MGTTSCQAAVFLPPLPSHLHITYHHTLILPTPTLRRCVQMQKPEAYQKLQEKNPSTRVAGLTEARHTVTAAP